MSSEIELMQEVVREDIALIQELFDEEIKPILDYKDKLNRQAFNKVNEQVQQLEKQLYLYKKVNELIGGLNA